ncbi:MAG: tetratricopeptide repeat protein [Acidobacteriia bacterium]|nr:tetratricopeptide repeat protein [Terriglobia bacterium]
MRAETRRSLKQDQFSRVTLDAAENAVHWTVEHQSKLIVAAIVVVVVLAAVLGGWYYLGQQDQKASVELSQAIRTLETPLRPEGMPAQPDSPSFASAKERATAAHQQFQAIFDKYSHTHSGDIARYFLGLTSADLGDNAAAERELRAVASLHNDDLSALARFALASVYRNTNRNREAVDLYKKLIDKPATTVSKVSAQLELAATYQADQQPLEAKRIYEQVQKENPNSEAAQLAASKLQEIK